MIEEMFWGRKHLIECVEILLLACYDNFIRKSFEFDRPDKPLQLEMLFSMLSLSRFRIKESPLI